MVKVTPEERISYFLGARIKGAGTRRKDLGQYYAATPVQEAKRLAMDSLKLSQQGVDPILADKKQRAKSEALSVTVGDTFDTYLRMKSLKARTERVYCTTFRFVFQSWADRLIRSISRTDAEATFLEAQKKRDMAAAGKALSIMSAVFNFAMADEVDGERLISENLFDVIKQKKLKRTPEPRNNYLSASEISRLITLFHIEIDWGSKQTKGVTPQGINYVMVLLSSGIRRSEGAGHRWEEVDWRSKVFVIRDAKNVSDHHIPMSLVSKWILEKHRKISCDADGLSRA